MKPITVGMIRPPAFCHAAAQPRPVARLNVGYSSVGDAKPVALARPLPRKVARERRTRTATDEATAPHHRQNAPLIRWPTPITKRRPIRLTSWPARTAPTTPTAVMIAVYVKLWTRLTPRLA